jgi:hypothetical protein
MSLPRVCLLAVCSLVASACSSAAPVEATEPSLPATLSRALAAGPVTFVLSQVEQQTGDEIVTFDHVCQGARIRMTLRDTITLSPDGAARRAFLLARTMGDTNSSRDFVASTGRWGVATRRAGVSGTRLSFSMTLQNGAAMSPYEVQLRDADAIVMRSGLGGSCPGSPNDGRDADFVYTRR